MSMYMDAKLSSRLVSKCYIDVSLAGKLMCATVFHILGNGRLDKKLKG